MSDKDIRDLYNYVDTLEKENKEFKSQVNETQLQKNGCERDLSSLAIISNISIIILLILLLIYAITKKIKEVR